ncbi:MAG: NACHT domain-containing protein [Methylococcales bacterium]
MLGDPGSGKSTLIGVLTYSFGRAGSTPFKRLFGDLLPVPVILRDYKVRQWQSYHDLLRDFVDSNLVQGSIDDAIRADITPGFLLARLRAGQAILMLDGLDEVGSREDRLQIREQVIFPLLEECAQSLVVLTSRIVGYDEVSFDQEPIATPEMGWDERLLGTEALTAKVAEHCYVAPFTEEDIEQFIIRWYKAREAFPDKQREGIESLKQALNKNDRVRRLADNPSLLTLIALIHRVTANLPLGRVNLYDKIVEAYLETIQSFRKLSVPASLDEMKRWLACVGWQMQERRDRDQQEDLLVHRAEVLQWLTEVIAEKRSGDAVRQDAEFFLEYVARRSGLLVPRGPDEFSFVHLTFQEYFAAYTLRGKVRRFDVIVKDCKARLPLYYWHETLGVLFEMLAELEGACDDLFAELKTFAEEGHNEVKGAAARFFSELLPDEQNGLSPESMQSAADFVLRTISRDYNSKVIQNLRNLPSSQFEQWVSEWFDRQLQSTSLDELGVHFFVAGNALLDDWPSRLLAWVKENPQRKLDDLQVAQIALFATRDDDCYHQISHWAVARMSLLRWLAPITFYFDSLSLAGAYRKELDTHPEHSVRRQLLLESHELLVIWRGQLLRLTTATGWRSRSRDFIAPASVAKFARRGGY